MISTKTTEEAVSTRSAVSGGPIHIGRDAHGTLIVSGDRNTISIYGEHSVSGEPVTAAAASPIGPNPYRGLAAFQEEDYAFFFGRESLTERLWNGIAAFFNSGTKTRFLAILGPSGSGKSSVVRAGLLPALARRLPHELSALRVAVMTPTSDPFCALAQSLARVTTGAAAPAKAREFEDELRRLNVSGQADGLRRVATSMSPGGEAPLLIVIDQFEELYTLTGREERNRAARNAFVETLLNAARDPAARVSVVITMRSDFLGETQRTDGLNGVIAGQHELVLSMQRDELQRAIEEPARRNGHGLSDSTIDTLLRDAEGRDGALPLLEFTLTRIWDELRRGRTEGEALAAVGSVGSALAARAEEIFQSLSPDEKPVARRLILGMVHVGRGAPDTRRRVTLGSLLTSDEDEERVRTVLSRFAETRARLVVLSASLPILGATLTTPRDQELGDRTAELSHEAVLRAWPRLAEWIEDKRRDLECREDVEAAARVWDIAGRPKEDLPQGALLEYYEKAQLLGLNPAGSRFLLASQQVRQQRREARTAISRDLLVLTRSRFRIFIILTGIDLLLAGAFSSYVVRERNAVSWNDCVVNGRAQACQERRSAAIMAERIGVGALLVGGVMALLIAGSAYSYIRAERRLRDLIEHEQ